MADTGLVLDSGLYSRHRGMPFHVVRCPSSGRRCDYDGCRMGRSLPVYTC